MARIRLLPIGLLLLICLALAPPARADAPPAIGARAWVLLNGHTGQIVAAQNPYDQNYPASTTKLLTALVALQHGRLTDAYRYPDSSSELPGDSTLCDLTPGETQSLKALLYGLLLPSGNDCALAIAAGQTQGHVETFVRWMNETTRNLGLHDSHFANPHGLHDPDHYTTAYDLAVISRAAFADPMLRTIAGSRSYAMPGHEPMLTHDELLFHVPGVFAGKTGYTEQALCTMVSAAQRDGHYLIGVILGEEHMPPLYADMSALLDWGFDHLHGTPAGPHLLTLPTAPRHGELAAEAVLVSTPLVPDPPLWGTKGHILYLPDCTPNGAASGPDRPWAMLAAVAAGVATCVGLGWWCGWRQAHRRPRDQPR